MVSKASDRTKLGIGEFAALKTAIVSGDEELVSELLPAGPMTEMEKSYLIDLAGLSRDPKILELLENAPVRK